MKNAWKRDYLLAGLASVTILSLIAGCTSHDAVSHNVGTIPSVTEMAPVQMVTIEITAFPTQTTTPTEIPIPTEIPRVRLTMDIQNPVFVSWEKAVSGQMDSAISQPFNKDAYLTFRINDFYDTETNTHQFVSPMSYPNPELRPFRISGFGETVTPDGKELIIVREDVHNVNDTIGHWNFIIEKDRFYSGEYTDYRDGFVTGEWYVKPLLGEGNKFLEKTWGIHLWELQLSQQTAPQGMEYYQEFIETNIINPDGENYLWIPWFETWR
jgi:hypothetical protein